MKTNEFDVTIIGAGPSGTACAIGLAEKGLRVALIDKATFPRDKICGDALNIDVVNQLALLSPVLAEKFAQYAGKTASYGVKIFTANYNSFDIPLYYKGIKSCGYVMERLHFDNFLYQYTKDLPHVVCFTGTAVQSVETRPDGLLVKADGLEIQTKMMVGADGAHSVVAKLLGPKAVERHHHSAGLRVYYEGVTGFHEGNLIELHFIKEISPGYLWVFPLPDGRANVGIGVQSHVVAKKKLNLRKILQYHIDNHPILKERFANARALETIKGYGLPLGGLRRRLSGNRFLLVGDAAGLIDPFTGEGIGNAVRSGRLAAKHIIHCFAANDFSETANKKYDASVYGVMWREFKINRLLLRLARYPWLGNLIAAKAAKAGKVRRLMIAALESLEKRRKLFISPSFYLRLLLPGKRK